MDYYEKDKEYKKDKGHKKSGFWHILGAFVLGGILLLSLLFFFNRPVAPAFGWVYGEDEETETALEGESVDFDEAGPTLNTTPVLTPDAPTDPPNGITVQTSGVYEISADVTVTGGFAEFQIGVFDGEDEELIEGSTFEGYSLIIEPVEGLLDDTENMTVGKTIQVPLNAGDTVFVEVLDTDPLDALPITYESPSLTVKRIGPLVDSE